MADLRFDPNNRRDIGEVRNRNDICRISRFLDAHGIPNVLWGDLVMATFLNPRGESGINFVIPDEHIDKARDLLLAAGFPPCEMGDLCPMYHPYYGPAIPYAHFNLMDTGPLSYFKTEDFGENPREWYTLELFKKSEVLWGAPEIPLGIQPNDPDWWTVNDERLPDSAHGSWTGGIVEADYPVKIPSPARFAEALTLLFFRDNFREDTARGEHWESLLLDMRVLMKKHYLFRLEDLPPRTRDWFTILTKNPDHSGKDAERLAAEMRKAGEVPESSPWPSEILGLPGWREELKQWEEEEQMRKKEEEERRKRKRKRKSRCEGEKKRVKEEQNA